MKKSNRPLTQNQSSFAQTVHADIRRSVFNRFSSRKTTFNCGDLVPIYCDEVLPGDTFNMHAKFLSRLSTPIFPTMDDIKLEFHAFFVPNRLVWDGWEELNGENKTGAWVPANPPALVPCISNQNPIISKGIGDYYGLPVGFEPDSFNTLSVLPFRGYALIYNDWYRDENLQAPLIINKGNDGNQDYNLPYGPNKPLLKVNKLHDYFTSALPAPQKGESALIPIELNELIPIVTGSDTTRSGGEPLRARMINGVNFPSTYGFFGYDSSSGGSVARVSLSHDTSGSALFADNVEPANLWADGTGIQLSSSTISELRTAFQIQKLYEKDARGGTRYIEMLKAHFGVEAGDYRLQRPEFLGSFSSLVGIQSVPQTAPTNDTSPQGNLAAFSVTVGQPHLFNKSFVEHGFIHIFAIARQVKTYQQGLEKFWSRRERFDFYYPTLAHISEQPIYNREIYALGDTQTKSAVFGYQEPWADYRYKPNSVTGQFRSGVENSLDVWHYADYYNSQPLLSADWITDNSSVNVNRTLAVKTDKDDQIRMDINFLCVATRPMPVYGIPGLVDHF